MVFFSNIEHHSNCVFWREMDCVSVVRTYAFPLISGMPCFTSYPRRGRKSKSATGPDPGRKFR